MCAKKPNLHYVKLCMYLKVSKWPPFVMRFDMFRSIFDENFDLNLQVSLWISNQPNIHSIFAYPLHRAQIKFSVKWSLGWVQNLRFCPIYRPLSLGSKMLLIILKCAEKWTRFCWVNWIAQKCRKPQFWGKNSQPISMRSWQYEFVPLALSGLDGSRLTGQRKSAVNGRLAKFRF